jgi:transposase InsO family protein
VLWCGDTTEIISGEGRLWCTSVIDLFSRRLLGYALGEHHARTWWLRRCRWRWRPAAAASTG